MSGGLLLALLAGSSMGRAVPIAQSLTSVTLYSAALLEDREVAPDSLAFAITNTVNLQIPLMLSPVDANGSNLVPKLNGFQVLIAGQIVPIYSVEASAETDNKLRIGVYLPGTTSLGNVVSVEVKRETEIGSQVIASGTAKIQSTAPNLFVREGYRNTPLVSINGATGMAGRAKASNTEEPYSVAGTPNIFSASQETRVVMFGTGFRGAIDSDPSNNISSVRNVAESYRCGARYSKYINGNYAGDRLVFLPVEYVGPAKGGMPGVDQIIVRLVPELKDSVLVGPDGPLGEVDITLQETDTGKDTEIIGEPSPRTRIFVK